jgi:hypothetical protein
VIAMTVEAASSAAAFVDSIGINVHFSYWPTPYGKRFADYAPLLERSGIKHVRDGVVMGQKRVCAEDRELAAHGVRFTYITQPERTSADLVTWADCVGNAIEAYEAPNEYDISHPKTDPDWIATVRTFQKNLYGWVKSAPSLRSLPVIGPSLTSQQAFASVGDLSAYLDYGNMHDYFGGHEPGTPGWGANGYGSIAYNQRVAAAVSGTKPIVATETGYGTENASGNVTEAVQAAYVPRMFLDSFAAGVPRTFEYELLDEGNPPYDKLGLIDADIKPKPAFDALSHMIALLDHGSPSAHPRVPLEVEGDTGGIRHLLLATSDRRCYLAVWQEAPSDEPKTRLPLPVPTRNVTVHVGSGWSARSTFVYGADDALHPQRGDAAVVGVGERVVFVEIDAS